MQNELDHFFQILFRKVIPFHNVTDSAFSQARKKLKSSAFKELNTLQVNHYYNKFETDKWNRYRLLAIDGSTLVLPNSDEIRNYFGTHKTNEQTKEVPLAHFSQCFDVLNHMTIDAQLGCYKGKGTGEQEHAIKHLEYIHKGDLVLMDRNYPCFYLFL